MLDIGCGWGALVIHAALTRISGPTANDPVARRSDIEALRATFNGHTHSYSPGTGASAPTGGPSSTQGPLSYSAKVRVD